MINRISQYIKQVIERNRFLSEHKSVSDSGAKLALQVIVSISFLIMSVANIFTKSYAMLVFTLLGFFVNAILAIISIKTEKIMLSSYSTIATCSIILAYFVVYGGNDGFASLWIVLLPIFSMAIMDFSVGLTFCIFIQVFLITVFWTPVNSTLFYTYNEQFCLRFPIFYFVSFIFGLITTIALQKSQYESQGRLSELEKITKIANDLAKFDPLTGLANRRYAYEKFALEYSDDAIAHCIVMGDIDRFKAINDSYGHQFGDEVLVTIAQLIIDTLPEDYLKSRWGGEEFLIAANQPMDCVYEKIEELRLKIAKHKFFYKDKAVNVTITFGISEYYTSEQINDSIVVADNRLYAGKKLSRNCTVIE